MYELQQIDHHYRRIGRKPREERGWIGSMDDRLGHQVKQRGSYRTVIAAVRAAALAGVRRGV